MLEQIFQVCSINEAQYSQFQPRTVVPAADGRAQGAREPPGLAGALSIGSRLPAFEGKISLQFTRIQFPEAPSSQAVHTITPAYL